MQRRRRASVRSLQMSRARQMSTAVTVAPDAKLFLVMTFENAFAGSLQWSLLLIGL